jgi:outer membrane receptor protein involved in Fe transport
MTSFLRITAVFAAALPALAQTMNTGAFLGTVTDPSGAAVAAVKVRLERLDPPLAREVFTDARGEYVAQEMPPGQYRIVMSAQGFETTVRAEIVISPGQSLRIDQRLKLGAITDTVTISEKVTTVESASPNVGSNIYADQVTELALNTRSFTQLLQLQPGVLSNQDQEQGFGSNTSVSVSFNGAPQSSNNITLDGTRNLDPYNGNNPTMVNLDAIAEVRVERNAYAAEYGRNSGAQINVVTKGGTNSLHGSAFEFFRNDKLNARNFFAVSRPKNRYNNFGWTLGGPIRRNKLFFFLSNEYRRIWQNTGVRTGQVLTENEINGRFTGRNLRDPLGGTFPGGVIPASRLDPQAQLLVHTFFPTPTPGFARGNLNYTSSAPDGTKYRSGLVRLDYNLTDRLNLFARFNMDSTTLISPYGLFVSANVFPNVAGSVQSHLPKTANATVNWIPATTVVNTLTVAQYHQSMAISTEPSASRSREPSLNIPRVFNTVTDSSAFIPSIAISGLAGITINWPQHISGYTTEVRDTVSWVRGRHTFKFGGSLMRENKSQDNSAPNNNGTFTFSTTFTGYAPADFMLGKAYQYTENSAHVWGVLRWTNYSLFAQHEWRVTPRLNFTYGVRWELYPPERENDNQISYFLPSAFDQSKAAKVQTNGQIVAGTQNYSNGVIRVGTPESPYGRAAINTTWNTIAPRGGFAWSLNRKGTRVLRGGAGMFHDRWPQYASATRTNWPFNQSISLFNTDLQNPGGGQTVAFPLAVTSFASPWRIPYMMKWSLGVQQQLPLRIVLDSSYVGSRGLHLIYSENVNQPQPTVQVANSSINVNAVRPYPGFSTITTYTTRADSVYHSLQLSGNRRFNNGFSLQVAYTFAKSIDNATTRTNIYFPLRYDRGVSNFDRTHVLTSSYVYRLPWGKRLPAVPRAMLYGWQFSGITSMQSGNPFSVSGADRAGTGAGQRPNVNAPLTYPRTLAKWFDTTIFSNPPLGTFGTEGRNILRGPSFQNWDLSVSKVAKIKEKVTANIRIDLFNIANHTQWLAVSSSYSSATFGQITTARYPRYVQLSTRLSF